MSQPTVVVIEEGPHFIVKIGKDTKGPFLKFPEVHVVPVSDSAFTIQIIGLDLQGGKVEIAPETHFVIVSRKGRTSESRKTPSQPMNRQPSNRPPPVSST